jgi:hypothetical protein
MAFYSEKVISFL